MQKWPSSSDVEPALQMGTQALSFAPPSRKMLPPTLQASSNNVSTLQRHLPKRDVVARRSEGVHSIASTDVTRGPPRPTKTLGSKANKASKQRTTY